MAAAGHGIRQQQRRCFRCAVAAPGCDHQPGTSTWFMPQVTPW